MDLPELGLENILAKVDTGANRSSIHCSGIKIIQKDGQEILSFHVPLVDTEDTINHTTSEFFKKKIRSSSGHVEERFIVKTLVVIFGRRIRTTFSLTDRTEMKYPVLLGRKLLKNKFVVDVTKENLSYNQKMQK